MKKTLAIFILLLCACVGMLAQRVGFVDSDWESMTADSIRPWSGFCLQLEGNWQDSVYVAEIEYPELVKITEETLGRWGIEPDDVPEWPEIESSIGVSRGSATFNAGFLPVIKRDGSYYVISSFKSVITSIPRLMPLLTLPSDERYTRTSRLSTGKWVKIRVAESGVYKLTAKALRSMGFNDPQAVRLFGYGGAVLPETNLQNLTDDLPEQPLWRVGNDWLFYAKGPVEWKRNGKMFIQDVNTYSDYGYYFLTDCADGDKVQMDTMKTKDIIGTLVEQYSDVALYDPDDYSWYRSGRRMFEEYDYAMGNGRSYKFKIAGINSDSVLMDIAFSSSSSATSKLTVSVNGKEAGVINIGAKGGQEVAAIKEGSLVSRNAFSDESQVRLVYNAASGVNAHLDYIRLNFNRRLAMYGSSTVFRISSYMNGISFNIKDSNSDVVVWRINSNGKTEIVPSVWSDGSTVTLSASFSSRDLLVAVNPKGVFPEPQVVGVVKNQNLHGMDSVDMVIVVPASGRLTAQAERLAAAHRSIDSLKVAVVRADMIYNEFSSGTPDATAIRRFMKMLYDRGDENSAPRYLLLMGDGAWDNRMRVSDWKGNNPDDYLLCYESYNSTSHIDSYVMEDYFGLLDDTEGEKLFTEKVDVGVGRLPVVSPSDASASVDKIIDYMLGKNAGAWCNKVMILGDDGDNNTHMADADGVAGMYESLYPSVNVRKVYWDAYKMDVTASNNGYPSIRKHLLEQFDEGALIVDYSGHGSTEVLSHELVMNKADMSALSSPRLPFWITASCDIAPFDSPLESMGLNLIRNAKGGAIGLLSTTRTVYANLNQTINRSFTKYVLASDKSGWRYALGDALRLAKNELVTSGVGETDLTVNKIHYVLLGDPALKLALPELTAVVDSFAGVSSTAVGKASAGSVITVRGHIERNGVKATDFNGELSDIVFDNERVITCFNNQREADEPFSFKYRDRILYSGTDSVKNGEFNFTFPVPLDINYSDEAGCISLYAKSNKAAESANGKFDNFIVGGTAPGLVVDNVGPDVLNLYLNTPSFQYGENVNSTPFFVAELRDSSGLNTSGNGLGHDILLVIDNNPEWTWVLNSYFRQNAGDFTRGTVTFSIPELPEGKHTLMFRAWDVMNNSTTVYLGFKVVNDLEPQFTVDVTESPARESTTFVITHDRPAQDAKVTVQVFSSDGTPQWVGSATDSSASGVVMIPWNLHGSSGHRMQPGLYFARVSIESGEGSGQASCKLVIMGP